MQNVKLDLSGSDMLQALADAASLQRRLAQQTSDAIEQAIESATDEMSSLLSSVGVRCPRTIFKSEWPTKVDRSTLDGIDSQLEELWKTTQSDRLISLARRLVHSNQNAKISSQIGRVRPMAYNRPLGEVR